jgi:hypothetical protein
VAPRAETSRRPPPDAVETGGADSARRRSDATRAGERTLPRTARGSGSRA